MEGGVEIKRVGWVFVGGDYHYSNATKVRYRQQFQQKWWEKLICGLTSVNICWRAGAKTHHVCDGAFLLVHIKSSLGFGAQHTAEKATMAQTAAKHSNGDFIILTSAMKEQLWRLSTQVELWFCRATGTYESLVCKCWNPKTVVSGKDSKIMEKSLVNKLGFIDRKM